MVASATGSTFVNLALLGDWCPTPAYLLCPKRGAFIHRTGISPYDCIGRRGKDEWEGWSWAWQVQPHSSKKPRSRRDGILRQMPSHLKRPPNFLFSEIVDLKRVLEISYESEEEGNDPEYDTGYEQKRTTWNRTRLNLSRVKGIANAIPGKSRRERLACVQGTKVWKT